LLANKGERWQSSQQLQLQIVDMSNFGERPQTGKWCPTGDKDGHSNLWEISVQRLR
jgi:hypothetical protein